MRLCTIGRHCQLLIYHLKDTLRYPLYGFSKRYCASQYKQDWNHYKANIAFWTANLCSKNVIWETQRERETRSNDCVKVLRNNLASYLEFVFYICNAQCRFQHTDLLFSVVNFWQGSKHCTSYRFLFGLL